jgi:uracil-DNA glycosylase
MTRRAEPAGARAPSASHRALLDRKDELLRGVDLGGWGPFIDAEGLSAALAALDARGDAGCLAPPAELIFEALRYSGPESVRVVIVAQDPYPTPAEAQGLCFSVPRGVALPPSLKRIFGCLSRAGLRRERAVEGHGTPVSGDLRPWAVQGVLLLNATLTTRVGARRAHAEEWAAFVETFLRRFCADRAAAGRCLHFLLWGGDARAFAPLARKHGHAVHEYTHPSPMADARLPPQSRFRECRHFETVNAALRAEGRRAIVWDNLAPVVAFSDGACSRNGKPGARASFAALVTGGQFGVSAVRGEVRPFEYAFADEADPERGVVPTDVPAAPSNNRGELLGLAYCALALLRGCAAGRVELVTDSKISARTLDTWLPARLKKGTSHELKNLDLVMVAWRLLELLRARAAEVALTHVHSHRPAPPPDAPSRSRVLWLGNRRADAHAAAALARAAEREIPDYAVEVLGAPPVLAALAGAGPRGPEGPPSAEGEEPAAGETEEPAAGETEV